MFDASALAIAMGHADREVKAQFVTASDEEDGFASAVKQWVYRVLRQ